VVVLSKRQQIISCLEAGLSAEETIKEVPEATLSYIYKVRSLHKKENNINISTKKQNIILELSKQKLSIKEISKKANCSIQYVYRVLQDKKIKSTKRHRLLHDKVCKEQDEYYTPLYAVMPISKYLKPNSTIWCPFDTEKSLYVRYFRKLGHTVIATHISNGQDFFITEPPAGCNYIISNPPYSIKEQVFERLFQLDIPFAMLVNTVGLFTAKSRFNLFRDRVEMLVFPARVQYLTSYDEITELKNPPFSSGYVCYRMLNKSLEFVEIERSRITL